MSDDLDEAAAKLERAEHRQRARARQAERERRRAWRRDAEDRQASCRVADWRRGGGAEGKETE